MKKTYSIPTTDFLQLETPAFTCRASISEVIDPGEAPIRIP